MDRGTKKWTALMLPEHVQALKEWRHEIDDKRPHPLADWQLEELNETVQHAFETKKNVEIRCFNGEKWTKHIGIIQKISVNELSLDDGLITKHIAVHDVYDVIADD